MADYNVDELSELVKADIIAESQGVGELPVVSSLSGINSLPALRGNEVVEAPLSLLSKPAEDAAKEAYAAIGNVKTATDNAVKATDNAVKATESAVKATESANEAAEAANIYANRVRDVTEEEWLDIEENEAWEEGVEYNVYSNEV